MTPTPGSAPPKREVLRGFAKTHAAIFQVAGAAGAVTPVPIPEDGRLDFYVGAVNGPTLDIEMRNQPPLVGVNFDIGTTGYLDGALFSKVQFHLGTPASVVFAAIVLRDSPPTFGYQSRRNTGISNTPSVQILDGAGNGPTILAFNNGGVVPADGVAVVTVSAASGAITLGDGTNTKNTGITGDGASWAIYRFPVHKGVTYTLSGTTLLLLGSKIVGTLS